VKLAWFPVLAVIIGLVGTRTNLNVRHALKANRRERFWWLLIALAWLPLVCWTASLFVFQD
jgi:hypothetical protein